MSSVNDVASSQPAPPATDPPAFSASEIDLSELAYTLPPVVPAHTPNETPEAKLMRHEAEKAYHRDINGLEASLAESQKLNTEHAKVIDTIVSRCPYAVP